MSVAAWRDGWGRVWRCRGLWGLLFALNLVSGLGLALIPAAGLLGLLGHRPALSAAAREGFSARLALDLLVGALTSAQLGLPSRMPEAARALPLAVLSMLGGVLIAPLVAWLPAAFLGGGLLATYAEQPRPWRWRRFLWSCWHYFGAFILLGLLQGAGHGLLVGPLALAGLVIANATGWPGGLVLGAAALLALGWQALCELARAIAVASGRRHAGRALGAALRLAWRRAKAVAPFYVLAFGALGLVHVLDRWAIRPYLPLHAWPLVLLVQQAFLALRLGLRLARLGGGLSLVELSAAPAAGAISEGDRA